MVSRGAAPHDHFLRGVHAGQQGPHQAFRGQPHHPRELQLPVFPLVLALGSSGSGQQDDLVHDSVALPYRVGVGMDDPQLLVRLGERNPARRVLRNSYTYVFLVCGFSWSAAGEAGGEAGKSFDDGTRWGWEGPGALDRRRVDLLL